MLSKKFNADLLQIRIKNNGFRLTGSRKTILEIINKSKKDLTAEDIFILSHKKNPKIGIATVYRTLGLLEKFNIIERIYYDNNKATYRLTSNIDIINKSGAKKTAVKISEGRKRKVGISANPSLTYMEPVKGHYYEGRFDNYQDIEKINKIQTQLNEWMADLNKIRREKEIELEEIINDFGRIDKILEKHELNKNNLIQMLIDFQTEYNWLPKHVLFYVGNKVNAPLSQIYSIASFYKFFNLEPRGKYQIIVCAGTACHVRGSMNLLQRIVNVLKIKPGDTTSDYKFTLDTVNCLGCCALGPVMLFNNKYYSNPSKKDIEKLFSSLA